MLTTSGGFPRPLAWAALGGLFFSRASSSTAPLAVPPSESWEGIDGTWSTFSIHAGTPEQVVNVLISTSFPNAALVLNESCSGGATSDCATARGGVFAPNASSTWQEHGVFTLWPELNYTTDQDRGDYGLDTIGLGLGDAGPSLDGQVIATLETTDYYIGMLGIDPQPTNWTLNFTVQTPSLFRSLYSQKLIPSLTYSYTAGASYRFKKVLGSLVFGGYDASRVETNTMPFIMAPDVEADLVVGVQSIQYSPSGGQNQSLLQEPVFAKIDSTVPWMVLPLEICREFESAFGLVWDPNAGYGGLYTLTDSQHDELVSSNPNFTFSLGNSLSGDHIDINLPYAAFDLTASSPFVNDTTPYFPLIRAANDSQITLGRAFLQETMLVADYDHGTFAVYQCIWNEGAQQDLQHVDLSNTTSSSNSTSVPSSSSNQAVTIGVGVGVGAGVPLILAVLLFLARRKRVWPFHKTPPPPPPKSPANTELDSRLLPHGGMTSYRGSNAVTKGTLEWVHEADTKGDPSPIGFYYRPELDGGSSSPASHGEKFELPSSAVTGSFPMTRLRHKPSELAGSSEGSASPYTYVETGPEVLEEVEGSNVFTELPGGIVSPAYLSPPSASRKGSQGQVGSGFGGAFSRKRGSNGSKFVTGLGISSASSNGGLSRSSGSPAAGREEMSATNNMASLSPAYLTPTRGSGATTRRSSGDATSTSLSGVSSASSSRDEATRQIVSALTETDPHRLFASSARR